MIMYQVTNTAMIPRKIPRTAPIHSPLSLPSAGTARMSVADSAATRRDASMVRG